MMQNLATNNNSHLAILDEIKEHRTLSKQHLFKSLFFYSMWLGGRKDAKQ